MIESITPHCRPGSALPATVGVRCEGEDFEHVYVRESDLRAAEADRELYRGLLGHLLLALHEMEKEVADGLRP